MNNDKLISQINKKVKKDKFFFKFKVRKAKKLLYKTAVKLRATNFLILKTQFNQSEENIIKILNILKDSNVLTYRMIPEDENYIEISFEASTEELPKFKTIKKLDIQTKTQEIEQNKEEKSLIKSNSENKDEEKIAEKNDQKEEPIAFGEQYDLMEDEELESYEL